MRYFFIISLLLVLFSGCQPKDARNLDQPSDPYGVASQAGDALNVIVEIPAGTNYKVEYKATIGFSNDTLSGGRERIINFLPYPGNYGFVPSTMMDKDRGGDGDPLDVLVLCESVPTGTLLATKPIGALLLRDRGEIDTKIIAVPADSSLRVFDVEDFLTFALEQDAARTIIETWFLNYKGAKQTELIRWEDEAYAWREVRKWTVE